MELNLTIAGHVKVTIKLINLAITQSVIADLSACVIGAREQRRQNIGAIVKTIMRISDYSEERSPYWQWRLLFALARWKHWPPGMRRCLILNYECVKITTSGRLITRDDHMLMSASTPFDLYTVVRMKAEHEVKNHRFIDLTRAACHSGSA